MFIQILFIRIYHFIFTPTIEKVIRENNIKKPYLHNYNVTNCYRVMYIYQYLYAVFIVISKICLNIEFFLSILN